MKSEVYKQTKLNIFESFQAGEINESMKDKLLTMLESKAEEGEGCEDCDEETVEIFDKLNEKFPDLKDDIADLRKKVCEGHEKRGEKKDDEDDEKEEKKEDKKEDAPVSEAAIDLLKAILSL